MFNESLLILKCVTCHLAYLRLVLEQRQQLLGPLLQDGNLLETSPHPDHPMTTRLYMAGKASWPRDTLH